MGSGHPCPALPCGLQFLVLLCISHVIFKCTTRTSPPASLTAVASNSLFPDFPTALLRQSHNTPPELASGVLAVTLKAKPSLPPAPHTFTAPHLPLLQHKTPPLGSPHRQLLFGPGDTLGLFYMVLKGFLDAHTLVSSVSLHHFQAPREPLPSNCPSPMHPVMPIFRII